MKEQLTKRGVVLFNVTHDIGTITWKEISAATSSYGCVVDERLDVKISGSVARIKTVTDSLFPQGRHMNVSRPLYATRVRLMDRSQAQRSDLLRVV